MSCWSTKPTGWCFNPRVLAGGRDTQCQAYCHLTIVSIHASSREDATNFHTSILQREPVSIHASSREDATSIMISWNKLKSFNPRVLAGGRDFRLHKRRFLIPVSIHASSREDATTNSSRIIRCIKFQSTRPRGRTRLGDMQTIGIDQFQSTRPRGRTRRDTQPDGAMISGFNPRVLAGGRDSECRKQYKSKCYICKSAKEIILIINEEQYHFS